MDTIRMCKQCLKPLPQNAPEGLCPECLARAALGSEPAAPGTRVSPNPADLAGQFPQLEILELLGVGGMGMVYKARQPRLDRLVALKILPIDSMPDASFAERFEREAKALAKLNHPGIVTLYDFGQTQEYYYFIMEFVDGMNLRQLIRAKTLEPRQALELVTQICTALQFAHDEKIVHRDIKPENILITKKGRVKIADFGLAKLLGGQPDTSLTASQMVMGTLNYMAPEQRENTKDVDHRADIYSLGVVFYEMLTGEVPMGRFEPPSKKVQVDVRLDEVVLHALEREPARRYQHVSEVKSNVETITASMPREKSAADAAEVLKPQPPGFVPFVLKRFAITGGAWLAVGLCLHWVFGDAAMTMTFKDNVWSWSLGNWAVTFPPSQPVPTYYSILGIAASLFYLGIAWIVLPAIFILTTIAWLDAVMKRGLSLRQLSPPLRRRYWLWSNGLGIGYVVLAVATMQFLLFGMRHAPVVFHLQESPEWWFVPSSGGYEKLGLSATFSPVEYTADVFYAPQTCTAISLVIHRKDKEPSVMNVTLSGLRAQYQIPGTNPWTATFVLDRDTLISWLHNGAGLDTDGPKFQKEVTEVYGLLKACQNEPPQTEKEFANLAKTDLQDFSFGGFQGGSGYYNSAISFSFFMSLIFAESLVFLACVFWATKRIFAEALAEIQSGRWTPPQKTTRWAAAPGSPAGHVPNAPKQLPTSSTAWIVFFIVEMALTLGFGVFLLHIVPGVGVVWIVAVFLVGSHQLNSRKDINDARESGLWPQPGELPTLEHVKLLMRAGKKRLAIKLYRQIHGGSLADAKAAVEKLDDPSRPASRKGFELFPKEWSVTHAGHSIRVRNSWNRGLKLFVDDVCRASTNRIMILTKSGPLLRYEMDSGTSPCLIEVYCYAFLEVHAKIVVNGQWIGGDNF